MANRSYTKLIARLSKVAPRKKASGIGRVVESFELRAAPNDPFGSFLLLGGFGLAIPVASDIAEESVTAESTSEESSPQTDAAAVDSFARRLAAGEGALHVGSSPRKTPAAYDEALGQVVAFLAASTLIWTNFPSARCWTLR